MIDCWVDSISARSASSSVWKTSKFSIKTSFQFWPHRTHLLPSECVLWCHSEYGKGYLVQKLRLLQARRKCSPSQNHRNLLQITEECGIERLSMMQMEISYLRAEPYRYQWQTRNWRWYHRWRYRREQHLWASSASLNCGAFSLADYRSLCVESLGCGRKWWIHWWLWRSDWECRRVIILIENCIFDC